MLEMLADDKQNSPPIFWEPEQLKMKQISHVQFEKEMSNESYPLSHQPYFWTQMPDILEEVHWGKRRAISATTLMTERRHSKLHSKGSFQSPFSSANVWDKLQLYIFF